MNNSENDRPYSFQPVIEHVESSDLSNVGSKKGQVCNLCEEKTGQDPTEPLVGFPPFHPNCRCRVVWPVRPKGK